MSDIRKNYEEMLSEMKKINSRLEELMEDKQVQEYLALDGRRMELEPELLNLHTDRKKEEFSKCSHIWIPVSKNVDYYEGRSDIDYGCMKCGLDQRVLSASYPKFLSVDDKVDVSEFKQKYQFSSTIDVLHYFEEHQHEKFSLFSKISDVRDYYIMWNLVNSLLPEGDLYYIEGDFQGYLVKQKNNYWFYFYDDNGNKYSISFGNSGLEDDYFNDDNIFSYLGSVRVED